MVKEQGEKKLTRTQPKRLQCGAIVRSLKNLSSTINGE